MKIFRSFIAFALVCFALLPAAQAVVPPPDGGYPNFTTAEGDHALQALTLGVGNTAIGTFSSFSVTTGSFNTAVGALALDLNTADSNTATGAAALLFNTTGTENTANGTAALEFNDTGSQNTANGAFALFSNTTATGNTANGFQALYHNTADGNTANGFQALFSNTTGFANTATGYQALFLNTTIGIFIGSNNTANGNQALLHNTTGEANTATGGSALVSNTIGGNNTATGASALVNNTIGFSNTATGVSALLNNTQGNHNIALGVEAGTGVSTADNVIAIGATGANVDDSCYIGSIFGQPIDPITATVVAVDTNGKLGTTVSSRRFKHDIKPMDKSSEAILALKPVTFHYKSDAKGTPQFGLIAEEVAEVNPNLVVRDKNGVIFTVRYEAVNAMLLNEFLKEHHKVEEQEATIAQLKQDFQSRLAQQQKQIEALAAGLQRVSAQLAAASPSRGGLDASKPAPQVVNNP